MLLASSVVKEIFLLAVSHKNWYNIANVPSEILYSAIVTDPTLAVV